MRQTMQPYELVAYPIENRLKHVLSTVDNELFVSTPFITDYGIEFVLQNAEKARVLKILTNLDLRNLTGTAFDIESLVKLWDRFQVSISSLAKLHAKVYIVDQRTAFLTSANLTRGGLVENYEYGILLKDERIVAGIVADMNEYFGLGNIFDRASIETMIPEVIGIREMRKELEKDIKAGELARVLRQKEESLQTRILRNRVKGRTINSIFSETIRYLLGSRGPLSTKELHPLVQNIHPEICDDSIDRVIDGQRFGKKWKHMVRNAQQHLKGKGIICLEEGKWRR